MDPVILNVSSKMEAKTMGAYTKEEFSAHDAHGDAGRAGL